MTAEVFLDTAYAIALSSPSDLLHHRTTILADQLEKSSTRMITTRAVLLEIGNALSKQRYRAAAAKLLNALETDPNIEIIPLLDELYWRALQLYQERIDKDWGLTDCISFVVIQERGMIEAFTPDEHFQQAGYRALMREDLPPWLAVGAGPATTPCRGRPHRDECVPAVEGGFRMGLFGPPNVEKLKEKRDLKGLIKALRYKRDGVVRQTAAEVLGEIGDARAAVPLRSALGDEDSDVR